MRLTYLIQQIIFLIVDDEHRSCGFTLTDHLGLHRITKLY
jgi:hypothetical protein